MIVFTNGCFDIIHPGHVDLLARAKALGTRLIVGINSDRSVRAIKGESRPLQDQEARKAVLLGIRHVDEVLIYDELTPEETIRRLLPDVLVKGDDWKEDEIIGSEIVKANGGRVVRVPLLPGYSTTSIAERMATLEEHRSDNVAGILESSIGEHLDVFNKLSSIYGAIEECAALLSKTFERGNKVLLCGNGGSAADAQHIAAEFVGRYENERIALPAISLTTDTSALTALANDYDFERIFARQVEALGAKGDTLVAISTSGNSRNVISAVMKAREKGCNVVGLTGAGGKKLASLCDACVIVPSSRTARIQEAHITVAHIWCEMIDADVAARLA
jgi:D-sedoheptulose 7-phosphate isomerase